MVCSSPAQGFSRRKKGTVPNWIMFLRAYFCHLHDQHMEGNNLRPSHNADRLHALLEEYLKAGAGIDLIVIMSNKQDAASDACINVVLDSASH
jgi:hypothetical protein